MMAGLAEFTVCGVVRAENYARAKDFYTKVLGLRQRNEFPGEGGGGLFEAGAGSVLMIYENPKLQAPENTTLGFAIPADRFDAVMDELRSRGVTFEEYDLPEMGLKTTGGVAEMDGEKTAWFKDTEGNILNIMTM